MSFWIRFLVLLCIYESKFSCLSTECWASEPLLVVLLFIHALFYLFLIPNLIYTSNLIFKTFLVTWAYFQC